MFQDKSGMTLIEVMIAVAIMLVVALGLSSLMFQQSNQQKSANAQASFNSLVVSVQAAASNGRVFRTSADAMGASAPGGNGPQQVPATNGQSL